MIFLDHRYLDYYLDNMRINDEQIHCNRVIIEALVNAGEMTTA
jgi:hypothetical protein